MFDLSRLREKLDGILPEGMSALRDEIQAAVKDILTDQLKKLDIVTREDFDAQSAVLQRLKQQVKQLETDLNTLLPAQSDTNT